jgi:hypothetical protein
LEGPATSEEVSQHPVFFDTLEHRQQDPVRELFPKCLRGGQAATRFVRRKPFDSNMDDRPTGAVHPSQEGRILVRLPRGTGWGKPQGGRIPGEPGRRLRRGNPVADVPTGWRMNPLKRGRRREIRRRRPASRTIDDPGHCRSAKAAPAGGCDTRRKARGRPLPEEVDPGGKPVSNGLLPADGPANRKRGSNAERRSDSSQVKLCRTNPVSAPG